MENIADLNYQVCDFAWQFEDVVHHLREDTVSGGWVEGTCDYSLMSALTRKQRKGNADSQS